MPDSSKIVLRILLKTCEDSGKQYFGHKQIESNRLKNKIQIKFCLIETFRFNEEANRRTLSVKGFNLEIPIRENKFKNF